MMMGEKNETVNIQVQIADRSYPLKVLKGDEQKVEVAVDLVTRKLKEYQKLFVGMEKQDYMAMCLLNLAVEQQSLLQNHHLENSLLEDKMNQIEEVLSSVSV